MLRVMSLNTMGILPHARTPVNVDRSHATGKPFVMAKENMILQDGQRKRSASTCQATAPENRCSQEGHESQLFIWFPQPGHRGCYHPTWPLVSTNIGYYTKRKNDSNTRHEVTAVGPGEAEVTSLFNLAWRKMKLLICRQLKKQLGDYAKVAKLLRNLVYSMTLYLRLGMSCRCKNILDTGPGGVRNQK